MMMDHDQKDAPININITSLTVNVAFIKSANNEKSISCAIARVVCSMTCSFCLCRCLRDLLLPHDLPHEQGYRQHLPVSAP
jgi:hypothetical protein